MSYKYRNRTAPVWFRWLLSAVCGINICFRIQVASELLKWRVRQVIVVEHKTAEPNIWDSFT